MSNLSPQSKTLSLDTDLRAHYLEWDQAQSPHTLVLVHGFLDSSAGWRACVESGLADDFHVIAPDMRGHGDSARVGAGGYYHFFDYVADLHSLIAKLGRDRVSLVGHSMGGSIAGYYAGAFSEELTHLALLEGMGPPEQETPAPDRVRHWLRSWNRARDRKPRLYESVEDAAAKLCQRDPKLSEAIALQIAKDSTVAVEGGRLFKHDPLHLSQGPYSYSAEVAGEFWQQINCPVLVVDGADSKLRLNPEEAGRRRDYLKRYHYKEILGAGHMIQRHCPRKLADILREFCGG